MVLSCAIWQSSHTTPAADVRRYSQARCTDSMHVLFLQRDIKMVPYEVKEAPDGFCLICVDYLGERQCFRPEQLVAMLMVDLKVIFAACMSSESLRS